VIVTWPGVLTVDGLADTPCPRHDWALAVLLSPPTPAVPQKLCSVMASVSNAAQIAQRRAMVHSFGCAPG
jgi:hypothetical protein